MDINGKKMQVELFFRSQTYILRGFFSCSYQFGKTGTRNIIGLNLFKILA